MNLCTVEAPTGWVEHEGKFRWKGEGDCECMSYLAGVVLSEIKPTGCTSYADSTAEAEGGG